MTRRSPRRSGALLSGSAVGDLLKAEISEKQARSIKYQLTVAKLPLAKDVDDRVLPQEHADQRGLRARSRCRWLHRPAAQRRLGRWNRHGQDVSRHRHCAKLHPRRITRALHNRRSRQSARGSGPRYRQGRLKPIISPASTSSFWTNSAISPSPRPHGQLLFHLISRLYERDPSSSPPTSPSANGRACSAIRR